MRIRINYFLIMMMGIFLLSGCIHRELIILGPEEGTEAVSQEDNVTTIAGDASAIPRIAFPKSEYSRLSKNGSGTVKGSIYVSDAYGRRVYGKQTRLYLNPVTSYSKQWYSESYIGGYKMAKADKRLFNYLKFTASNTRGKFAFYGVPSGSYYVIGVVKCAKECGYATPTNIRIAKEVTVRGSNAVVVDLDKMIE